MTEFQSVLLNKSRALNILIQFDPIFPPYFESNAFLPKSTGGTMLSKS